jgi:hypothetical protein
MRSEGVQIVAFEPVGKAGQRFLCFEQRFSINAQVVMQGVSRLLAVMKNHYFVGDAIAFILCRVQGGLKLFVFLFELAEFRFKLLRSACDPPN